MDYQHSINTKPLDIDVLRKELSWVVNLLQAQGRDQVQILFGFAWGLEYRDWTEFFIKTSDILTELDKVETLGYGELGLNDLHLLLDDIETEMLFCNDADIHINFNNRNIFVDAVLKRWNDFDLAYRPAPAK